MHSLFMALIGATPPGRHTEQHDIYFGIGQHIRDLVPGIEAFWPEAKGRLHLDAWRAVTLVDGFRVSVQETAVQNSQQLFFINLGGYRKGEFDEFHYKMLVAAPDKGVAVKRSKETAFFRHTGFPTANAHIDDKYGVDVDDIHAIPDILPPSLKQQFHLHLQPAPPNAVEDELHLGYFRLEKL